MDKQQTLAAERRNKAILSVVLAAICILWVLPVVAVVINSFKLNTFVKTDTFALPTSESWGGDGQLRQGHDLWQLSLQELGPL